MEGFSISGVATWLAVPELDALFDVGECPLNGVPLTNLFLTHIHGDHSRCLLRHEQLRRMFGLTPATYWVPAHAVDGLKTMARVEAQLSGAGDLYQDPDFRILENGVSVPYKKGLWVRAFPVKHRVPSQGFTIGRVVQKLLPEFEGKPGSEIGSLRKSGVQVTAAVETPLFTFIGDTEGVSLSEESHIWDSKVVVTECTYIDPEHEAQAAQHGHTHLEDIVRVLNSLPAEVKCEALVLKHFSLQYDPAAIREQVWARIPEAWRSRVFILLPESVS
jgi:ribonuclease Z